MPELVAEKPICVALHAQEIGKLFATKTTTFEYMQGILYRLRLAGAPIEGVATLRLAHGKVFKMHSHPLGRAWIGYLWLPETKVAELEKWRKDQGLKSLEGVVN